MTSDKLTAGTQDGDIDMSNVTCSGTVLTSEYGDIEGENIKSSGLSVKSQQGDVDLQGEFSGTTDVYLACGDVELRTSMARDLYTIDAQAKSGEIGIGSDITTGMTMMMKMTDTVSTNRTEGGYRLEAVRIY